METKRKLSKFFLDGKISAQATLGEVGSSYVWYVLAILTFVNIFNFLDRQLLSILAERIKYDLALSDTDLGFLYGTAFAVCLAVFGIPLGRLSDTWERRYVIAIGLILWSGMTALSGLSQTFLQLSALRIGVAIGEASLNPAAHSSLSDWFPRHQRATVLAIYTSGAYIGGGVSLFVGGQIVGYWDLAFAGGATPFGLRGWQIAFFAAGLPGILLALLVWKLREPVRGQSDGLATPRHLRPLREFMRELGAVVPPATVAVLIANGARIVDLAWNIGIAIILSTATIAMTSWLGNPAQWITLAVGLYAACSWGQNLRLRDLPSFTLILNTPTLWYATICFSLLAFTTYGLGFWTAPYFVRMLGAREGEVGMIFGLTAAAGGLVGIILGGVLADRWRRHHPAGRLFVAMLSSAMSVPVALWLFTTENVTLAYVLTFPLWLLNAMWVGCGAATVQDLVLPRMRASASAAYTLFLTLMGLAMGPYVIGRVSVALGDLRSAILWALLVNAIAFGFAILAARYITHDEATLHQRARAAGEPAA